METEAKISHLFYSCPEEMRRKMQEKIPIKILARLKKRKDERGKEFDLGNRSEKMLVFED